MPYKYKVPSKRKPRFNLNRIQRPSRDDQPELTGWVNGKIASDIEERFARALREIGYEFKFQAPMPVSISIVYEKSIDFLVYRGIPYPVEIDGEYSHGNYSKQAEDALRDQLLNDQLMRKGYGLIQRIPWYRLETQEKANETLRRLFG